MKILFVTGDAPSQARTGYMMLTEAHLKLLRGRHGVRAVALQGPSGSASDEFEVLHETRGPKRFNQLWALARGRSSVEAGLRTEVAEEVCALAEDTAADALILNHIRAAWIAPHLPPQLRTRTIYLAQNAEAIAHASMARLERQPLRTVLARQARAVGRVEVEVLRACAATIALTAEDRARMQTAAPGARVLLAPPPLLSLPVAATPESAPPNILLIGSFRWRPKLRNAEWLAREVMPIVRRSVPEARLVVVGQDAWRLRGLVRDAGIELHANVPSTEPYFERAAIFAVPERQEGGIKLKTLEAASAGLPVVSTTAGVEGTGLAEAGGAVVANQADSFAAALVRLLLSPNERADIGGKGRQAVLRQFDPTEAGTRLLEHVERVVGAGEVA